MDRQRFDTWTKTWIADPTDRRGLLRRLIGGAGGALLALPGPDVGTAACAAHTKACKADGGCCSGFCEKTGKCTKRGKLSGKCRCQCPVGTTPCGTKSCCGAGQTCQTDRCVGSCAPNCAGKSCGDDGCGGSCGVCIGGRVCQLDGTCACPPGKPVSGVCGIAPDECRECCIDTDCGSQFSGYGCFHDEGSICRCRNTREHDCGQGICWMCCADAHCSAWGMEPGNGFYCSVEHSCRCNAGTTMCEKPDLSGWECVDTRTNEAHCGGCRSACPGSSVCVDGRCVNP